MAAELAVKVINKEGGFNGVPIKLVNYDDQVLLRKQLKLPIR